MLENANQGRLSLKGVQKTFGHVNAVAGVNLEIAAGEFIAFLGPSGCGKTTLLRLIAGFEEVDSGEIALDGKLLCGRPPNHRDVGLVFQNLALFPHLTVAENVGFGLSLRGKSRSEIRAKVSDALALVDLDGFGQRRVQQLSGGQKQRVALARALVLQPSVLLLDEPLSALDAKLRRQLQQELKSLQRQTSTTFIFVTHDQEEALSLADRVAVFNAGRVEQFGAPQELYGTPATRFVAEFVGDANIRTSQQLAPFAIALPDDEVLVVRPEQSSIGSAAAGSPVKREATVQMVDFVGPHARVHVVFDGTEEPWLVLCPGAIANSLSVGSRTILGFDPAQAARVKT
jgi:ABC-type Fe3+/spermidine/putrescine transport system ATPase subunit